MNSGECFAEFLVCFACHTRRSGIVVEASVNELSADIFYCEYWRRSRRPSVVSNATSNQATQCNSVAFWLSMCQLHYLLVWLSICFNLWNFVACVACTLIRMCYRPPSLLVKKGKVFPYSLPSVGPGADPGVQAVSPQVTWSESRHIPAVVCHCFLPGLRLPS